MEREHPNILTLPDLRQGQPASEDAPGVRGGPCLCRGWARPVPAPRRPPARRFLLLDQLEASGCEEAAVGRCFAKVVGWGRIVTATSPGGRCGDWRDRVGPGG